MIFDENRRRVSQQVGAKKKSKHQAVKLLFYLSEINSNIRSRAKRRREEERHTIAGTGDKKGFKDRDITDLRCKGWGVMYYEYSRQETTI